VLCLGLISVEQRASLSEAKAGEQRAPCTRWPGAKALRHLDITSAWSTTSSRQVRKGWCDLAEANGSDTGSRQGAGQTGPTPCLHYDLTPESGSRRGSTTLLLALAAPTASARTITVDVTVSMASCRLMGAAAVTVSDTDFVLYRPLGRDEARVERVGPDLLSRWSTPLEIPSLDVDVKVMPAPFFVVGPDFEGVPGTTVQEMRTHGDRVRLYRSTITELLVTDIDAETGQIAPLLESDQQRLAVRPGLRATVGW